MKPKRKQRTKSFEIKAVAITGGLIRTRPVNPDTLQRIQKGMKKYLSRRGFLVNLSTKEIE